MKKKLAALTLSIFCLFAVPVSAVAPGETVWCANYLDATTKCVMKRCDHCENGHCYYVTSVVHCPDNNTTPTPVVPDTE